MRDLNGIGGKSAVHSVKGGSAGRGLLRLLVASLLFPRPLPLSAQEFYEPFRWKGVHAAGVDGGAATTVFWDWDAWNTRSDTGYFQTISNHALDIRHSRPSLDYGGWDDVSVVGGNGEAGVGVFHLEQQSSISARLRNPMLISASQPGVVEWRVTPFVTSGHWWEVVITPADGQVDGGEYSSIPVTPGYNNAEDSINFVTGRDNDIPCYTADWWSDTKIRKSLNNQHDADEYLGPRLHFSPTMLHDMARWRLEYYPDRIVMRADLNKDGVFDTTDPEYHVFPVSIPWSSVYVHFMAVGYETDHHPQAPCNVGDDREFYLKDVHVGPVKYGRTVVYPKDSNARAWRASGWMAFDIRDNVNWGAGTNGLDQPNPGHDGDGVFCQGMWGRCDDVEPPHTLKVYIPEDLAHLKRAQLVYDVNEPSNFRNKVGTLSVNGGAVGPVPGKGTVPSATQIVNYAERSIDLPLTGPGSLVSNSTNTFVVAMNAGPVQFDRLHLELDFDDTVPLPPVPGVPTGLIAPASGPRRVDVSWSGDAVNVDGFRLQRRTGAGVFRDIALMGPGQTGFSDTTVAPDTDYSYQAAAFNQAGVSSYSTPASVHTPADPLAVPAAPPGITVTALSPDNTRVSWTDVADEDGYIVEEDSGHGFVELGVLAANETSFINRTHFPGETFRFRVRGFNAAGKGSYSATGSVTSPHSTSTKPADPANVRVTGTSATTIALAWDDMSNNETGFVITRAESPSGDFRDVVDNLWANQTAFLDTELQPDTTYYYKVQAFNDANDAGFGWLGSAEAGPAKGVTTAPPSGPPVNPSGLRVAEVTNTSVTVSWNDNSSNEDQFILERSIDGGAYQPLPALLTANTHSYKDGSLPTGVAYSYRVKARNALGDSAYSNSEGGVTGQNFTTVINPGGGSGGGSGTGTGTGAGSGNGKTSADPRLFAVERIMSPGLRDGINDQLAFDPEAQGVEILGGDGRTVLRVPGPSPVWDGRDDRGRPVPSGLYIAKVTGKDGAARYQKILIAK